MADEERRMILPPSTNQKIVVKPVVEPLAVVCAWCPGAREKTLALRLMGRDVTHGMCPACREKFEREP
jgi:hypothetical protein